MWPAENCRVFDGAGDEKSLGLVFQSRPGRAYRVRDLGYDLEDVSLRAHAAQTIGPARHRYRGWSAVPIDCRASASDDDVVCGSLSEILDAKRKFPVIVLAREVGLFDVDIGPQLPLGCLVGPLYEVVG